MSPHISGVGTGVMAPALTSLNAKHVAVILFDEQIGQRIGHVVSGEMRFYAFKLARGQHLLHDKLGLEIGQGRIA